MLIVARLQPLLNPVIGGVYALDGLLMPSPAPALADLEVSGAYNESLSGFHRLRCLRFAALRLSVKSGQVELCHLLAEMETVRGQPQPIPALPL